MSTGLIALLDDVAGIAKVAAASLDDIAGQAARAGAKSAGVVIDDAAVTPRYVVGFAEGLLEVLIRRGDAVREPLGAHCSGCGGTCSGACGQQALTIYRAT